MQQNEDISVYNQPIYNVDNEEKYVYGKKGTAFGGVIENHKFYLSKHPVNIIDETNDFLKYKINNVCWALIISESQNEHENGGKVSQMHSSSTPC